MEKAVIQADFVDYKNVKTRSKMQLIFEVDVSMAKHCLDVLGYSDNSKSIACAIARLSADTVKNALETTEKLKSFAGQAKLLAKEDSYWMSQGFTSEVAAEAYIENFCGVTSCSQIIDGTPAGEMFKKLQRDFYDWRVVRRQEDHYLK